MTPKFIESYRCGAPVVVMRAGRAFGIPVAFVEFDDGVAWCDDGVLQESYCTHHPHHQIYGRVEYRADAIICEEFSFQPGSMEDLGFAEAWIKATSRLPQGDWTLIHRSIEDELRAGRTMP